MTWLVYIVAAMGTLYVAFKVYKPLKIRRWGKDLVTRIERAGEAANAEAESMSEGSLGLEDLLTDQFLRKYTSFHSYIALVEALGFDPAREKLDDPKIAAIDKFVAEYTRCESLEELLEAAKVYYVNSLMEQHMSGPTSHSSRR